MELPCMYECVQYQFASILVHIVNLTTTSCLIFWSVSVLCYYAHVAHIHSPRYKHMMDGPIQKLVPPDSDQILWKIHFVQIHFGGRPLLAVLAQFTTHEAPILRLWRNLRFFQSLESDQQKLKLILTIKAIRDFCFSENSEFPMKLQG